MQTLILNTNSSSQVEIFLRLAHEMHIEAVLIDNETTTTNKMTTAQLSESAFSKEWNSEADQHWDIFLK